MSPKSGKSGSSPTRFLLQIQLRNAGSFDESVVPNIPDSKVHRANMGPT